MAAFVGYISLQDIKIHIPPLLLIVRESNGKYIL